jgi:nitrogen regulatory protein P-II 1
MKEIKAIIRPFKLTDVITELHQIDGLPGVTISEVKRFGKSSANDIEKNRMMV